MGLIRMAGVAMLVAVSACTGAGRVQAGDVRAGAIELQVSLDRAVDAHEARDHTRALESWRRAHQTWDTTVAPGLERSLGPQEVVALELHLARIRAALDDPGASPVTVREAVQTFDQALDSPLQSLPPAANQP